MASKRSADDEPEELRTLLQAAKEKVARVQELLDREEPACCHAERVMVVPSGPRDNGEYWYVCTRCGDVQ